MKKKTQKENQKKIDWFMLMGYNKENQDETGFLAIDPASTGKHVYKKTKDRNEALKFPSENVYNVDSFGTPKQWLEFFKGEDELSNWEFHLVKTKDPRKIV